MLGVRPAQRGLLEADHLYLDYVGRGSFYGFLASLRGQHFETKSSPNCIARTMAGIAPPSLVATALLLQAYDKVSDLKPSRGRTSISGGRWRWGLRWRTVPLPRAPCNCFEPS